MGYFYLLSEFVTPESINLMVTHARGLVSVTITKEKAKELSLPLLGSLDGNQHKNFTVSIDYEKCTTGISALNEAKQFKH